MRRDWSVSSLGERIRWIAETHYVSLNEVTRRAGMGMGTGSRLARDAGPVKRSAETLRRIADAWNVSLEWLTYGRGQPERMPERATGADLYPNRAEAARIAREDGTVPSEAIEAVLSEVVSYERDPSVLWWIHLIERYALILRQRPPTTREQSDTPVENSGPRTLRAAGERPRPAKK